MRRGFASLLAAVSTVAVAAQAPLTSPADRWSQFRGTPPLVGTSDAKLAAAPKLLWTYEAGDAIESSAAIVDGVVYVGSQSGELHAVNLADGKAKWKYKASADGIGESSPTVAGGFVYIGDLSGVLHAVNLATGQAAWTFKTGSEIKSSPVVAGDKVIVGSYDQHLYALGAKDGKLAWKVPTEGYVHATPAIVDGVAYIAGCDEILRGIRIADGAEILKLTFGAYTGASPAVFEGRAYYGTYENEVLGVDLKAKKVAWTYKHPERNFPFYSSPAIAGDRDHRRRPRQDGARARSQDRQVAVDVHHRRPGRFVSGRSRRPCLHRFERRQALRARRDVGQERLPVRGRRSALGVALRRLGTARDRVPGRQAVLPGVSSCRGSGLGLAARGSGLCTRIPRSGTTPPRAPYRLPMEVLRRDLVFALRLLRRDPAYTATVLLTLAICLGANAAIFTVVRSVLLRPLPYDDPSRIVFMYDSFPGAGVERAGTSVPNYFDRAALAGVFDSAALYQGRGFDAGEAGSVERLSGQVVTPSFFRVLGIGAGRGRVFTDAEVQPGKDKLVVISHAYWISRFGGREDAIGQSLRLNGEPYVDARRDAG